MTSARRPRRRPASAGRLANWSSRRGAHRAGAARSASTAVARGLDVGATVLVGRGRLRPSVVLGRRRAPSERRRDRLDRALERVGSCRFRLDRHARPTAATATGSRRAAGVAGDAQRRRRSRRAPLPPSRRRPTASLRLGRVRGDRQLGRPRGASMRVGDLRPCRERRRSGPRPTRSARRGRSTPTDDDARSRRCATSDRGAQCVRGPLQ